MILSAYCIAVVAFIALSLIAACFITVKCLARRQKMKQIKE